MHKPSFISKMDRWSAAHPFLDLLLGLVIGIGVALWFRFRHRALGTWQLVAIAIVVWLVALVLSRVNRQRGAKRRETR